MNDQLEHDLRHHFDHQTSHLPVSGPGVPITGPIRSVMVTDSPRRSTFMLVAAASIVVLAVGGLFVLTGRSGDGDVSTSDTGPAAEGSVLEPVTTLPDSADVSSAPVTVAADEPTDWYRVAPDLDIAWFQSLDGTSPSMFCWRTPIAPAGVCTIDAVGGVVVPLVVPTAGGQTLVLAGGDRTNPTLEITLDDGSSSAGPQDFDDTIDWGVARFAFPADRSIVLVNGQQIASNLPTPETGLDESADLGAASVEAFCVEYASLQGEQPESYLGSSEHLADIDGLLVAAPEPVAGELITFRDYISSGAIDSEGDPDSNLTENWPDEVQTAIANTQAFADENC